MIPASRWLISIFIDNSVLSQTTEADTFEILKRLIIFNILFPSPGHIYASIIRQNFLIFHNLFLK